MLLAEEAGTHRLRRVLGPRHLACEIAIHGDLSLGFGCARSRIDVGDRKTRLSAAAFPNRIMATAVMTPPVFYYHHLLFLKSNRGNGNRLPATGLTVTRDLCNCIKIYDIIRQLWVARAFLRPTLAFLLNLMRGNVQLRRPLHIGP